MIDTLLNRSFIRDMLTNDATWCGSHGADGENLGAGILYYSLVYMHAARIAVCLGSGGGFVPRVMRQAQRDLCLDGARTILIDANKPDAGWGSPCWLSPNSFFRKQYPDIECIMATTIDAARQVLGPQDIIIDYLHIDADHSYESCLNDFLTYRRFLRPGSVVTLHDTNFPSAGVRYVIEYLNTRSDCEVINFLGLGVGTALVRITGSDSIEAGSSFRNRQKNYRHPVIVTRKLGACLPDPPTTGWRYLECEAFTTRSVIAARFMRGCRVVIEIGSGKTPIDRFLTELCDSIIAVGPSIREGRWTTADGSKEMLYLRAHFQDLVWEINEPQSYGLVMLGLELEGMTDESYRELFRLVECAAVTVIEFASTFSPAREQFEKICLFTATRERFVCRLDLSGNDVGDRKHSWSPRFEREIHVLVPKAQTE